MSDLKKPDEFSGAVSTAIDPEAASPEKTVEDPEIAYQLARLHGKEAIAIFSWMAVAVVGFYLFLFGESLASRGLVVVGVVAWAFGTLRFVSHCRTLAARKGYSPSAGYLALLPPYIGLATLVWLPERTKRKDYHYRRREQLSRWRGPTYR